MDRNAGPIPSAATAGALNLLRECAGVHPGDEVLLVTEPHGDHYDPALAPFIAQVAEQLGARARILAIDPATGPEDVPAALFEAIAGAAHTIFLNRIGDQLRFSPLPGSGSKTMCYTLDLDLLGSEFATSSWSAWQDIHARLTARIAVARGYTIRCPRGTELRMERAAGDAPAKRSTGFTVRNFPVMIVAPVSAAALNGRLVLSQALTSTYVHYYDDSVLPLSAPLVLTIEDGMVTGIDGDAALVARAERQFARVHALFGGAQWALNSWHAGINVFTSFPRPALSDIDRWSCVAFGSPRYAHFHLCGPVPGDICGQVFDPTIAFDDATLWEGGRAAFLDADDARALQPDAASRPDLAQLRLEIGVS